MVGRRFWTTDEVMQLQKLYPNTPMSELISTLNRPAPSILAKAKEIGVKRSQDFLKSKHSGRVQAGNARGQTTRFQKGHKPSFNAKSRG